jgi:hypothetical protein
VRSAQGPGDGHRAAGGAEPLPQFLKRGIGLLSDQLPEPFQVLWPEFGWVPSTMGPGSEGASAAVELQQSGHEGQADQEPTSDLAQGTLPALDRFENPLSEILRVGGQSSPPYSDLRSNRAPSNCSAL